MMETPRLSTCVEFSVSTHNVANFTIGIKCLDSHRKHIHKRKPLHMFKRNIGEALLNTYMHTCKSYIGKKK